MTFVHPFVLILLFLPLSWLVWSLGHSRQRLGITLKALSIASILVALAEPRVTLPRTKTATLILVDTSRSLSTESLARASALVKQMERSKGSNWIKIVPFTS